MSRVCLAQKNIRKYASRYPLKPRVACRWYCWGRRIAVSMTKRSSEEFQEAKCRASYQTQRYMLWWSHCRSFDAVYFCFSFHSSTITLGLLLLHFGSRIIFFTRRSLPGRTSTTWLVVRGRYHRNRAQAIKV